MLLIFLGPKALSGCLVRHHWGPETVCPMVVVLEICSVMRDIRVTHEILNSAGKL